MTNFEKTPPKVEVEKSFALLHLFSLQNIIQETRLYHSGIGSDICLKSPERELKRKLITYTRLVTFEAVVFGRIP